MMLVVLYPLIYVISCSVSSPLLVVQSKVVLFPGHDQGCLSAFNSS